MKEKSNLNTEFIESITSKEAISVAGDLAELGLDSLLEEGILKDIPFFGTVIKMSSIIGSVRDRLFLKKVSSFLFEISKISEQDRNRFRNKIKDDKNFQSEVGENLMLLLERHEHMSKPRLLAKAFGAYIEEKISYNEFLKLASSIDSAFINDLLNLPSYYKNIKNIPPEIGDSLYRSGLVNLSHAIDGDIVQANSPMGYTTTQYLKNDTGTMLSSIINSESVQ